MQVGNFGFGDSGSGGGGGGTIIGGGTLNYVSKFTPNGTTIANSLLYDNGTSVGLGTNTPDASALLDLSSTTQGFAAPRMTTLQRDAIVAPVVSLLIFNTSSGFYNYWDGITWIQMDTSTGGDVSGSGTTNYAVKWTDGANSVIGDGTWAFSGNHYYPVTTGSNIGDATHRIGTIFMASVFDYANNLTFFNGTSTTMTLTTSGNLGIGTAIPTSKLDVNGQVVAGLGGGVITSNDSPFYAVRLNTGNPNYYSGFQYVFEVGGGVWGIGMSYPNNEFQFLTNGASTAKFVYGDGNSVSPNSKFVMDLNGGFFGANIASPTANIHAKGIDNTLANYTLKSDDSLGNPLLYIRNDGYITNSSISDTTSFYISNKISGDNTLKVQSDSAGRGFVVTENANINTGNAIQLVVSNTGVRSIRGLSNNAGAVISNLNIETIGLGVGSSIFSASAMIHIQGIDSTLSNYALKADNYLGNPLLYVRNDSKVSVNTNTFYNARLNVYNISATYTDLIFQAISDIPFVVNGLNAFSVNTAGRIVSNIPDSALAPTLGHYLAAPIGSTRALSVTTNAGSQGLLEINIDGSFAIGHLATITTQFVHDGLSKFTFTGDISQSVGINIANPTATTHIQGRDNTLANYALKADNSASSPLLYVRNDGMVGIGTIPSNIQLEVVSSDNSPYGFSIRNNTFSSNAANGYKFYQENDGRIISYNNSQLLFAYGASGNIMFSNSQNIISSDTKVVIQAISDGSSNYSLYARGNSINSGLSVDGNGNVGINQLTAGAKLHIKGIDSTSSNYALKVDNSASTPLIYVRNDGNIGIGTSSPSYALDVKGTGIIAQFSDLSVTGAIASLSSKLMFGSTSNHDLSFLTVGSERMTISNSGNVGIGTTSASARLHVKGIDATSANYALKVDNSLYSSILSLRNDHFVDINVDSKYLRILSTSSGSLTPAFTIFDVNYGEAFRVEGTYGRNYMGTTPTSFNNSATLNLGSWGLGRFLYFGTDGSQATFTDADGTGIIFTGKQKTLATIEFKLVSDEGLLVGNGNTTAYFRRNVDVGGNGTGDGISRVYIKGETSDLTKNALSVINNIGTPLLYSRNDGEIGMNGFTIRQLASATYFKTSGTNGYVFNNASDSTNLGKISNTGQILFGDLTDANYVGVGIAVKALSLTSNGSKEIVGALFKSNTDQDGVYFSSKQGAAYVQSYSVNTVNQSLILGGRNSSAGTLETLVLDSNGNVGIGTLTPATSALLDLTSTTGALLVPRMTTTQKNALTAVNGMIIYDTTLDKFQGYEAGAWTNLI